MSFAPDPGWEEFAAAHAEKVRYKGHSQAARKVEEEASHFDEVLVDEVLRETPKAYLFRIGKEAYWFPRSQLNCDCKQGDKEVTVMIPLWLARAKFQEKK